MSALPTTQSSSSNPTFINYQGTARELQDQVIMTPSSPIFDDFYKNRTIFFGEEFDLANKEYNKDFVVNRYSFVGDFGIIEDIKFLSTLKAKEDNREELEAIEDLYKYINPLLNNETYFRVDLMGSFLKVFRFKLKLIISYLTITHSIKEYLRNRNDLIIYAKEISKSEGLTPIQIESLLKGF